jgi:molybdopterin-guanine dinucleotide biosynthesis protein A
MPATERAPAGVILAGGRGERLGLGKPKAWVPVAGVTLLERALVALAPHAGGLWVVAPRGMALPPGDYRRVEDVAGAAGPLAGLAAALEAVGAGDVLVLGVDYPLVRPALLELLARRPGAGHAAVPRVGGRLHPLVARHPAAAAPALRARLERGERALVPAVLALGPDLVEESELRVVDPDLRSFLNVNTPADLERAVRALEGAPA